MSVAENDETGLVGREDLILGEGLETSLNIPRRRRQTEEDISLALAPGFSKGLRLGDAFSSTAVFLTRKEEILV